MNPVLERIEPSEQNALHAFLFSDDTFDAPWHFHPEYELTLILESSGIRYVGNNISDFKEGDLVMLGSNLPHCWKNSEDHQGISRSLVIQWKADIIHSIPIFDKIHALMLKSMRGLLINVNLRIEVRDKMYQVLESNGTTQYIRFIELLSVLANKGNHITIAGPSYSYDHKTLTTDRLEQVQSYVKDHYKEKIKLSDVSDLLSMSEQSFSRFFSKTMNKPFFEFLNQYRVNIASRQILETDKQMTEIAYKCGYDSLPFFYKQFKKFKRYTPLEFRKMYRSL